jgi:hypothetical protein
MAVKMFDTFNEMKSALATTSLVSAPAQAEAQYKAKLDAAEKQVDLAIAQTATEIKAHKQVLRTGLAAAGICFTDSATTVDLDPEQEAAASKISNLVSNKIGQAEANAFERERERERERKKKIRKVEAETKGSRP